MADASRAATQTALVGGVLALMGAVGGAAVTGWSQVQLAKQKFNSDLVLRALESESAEERLKTLELLVETKLLKDSEIEAAVRAYAKKNKDSPQRIPKVAAPIATLAPPADPARTRATEELDEKRGTLVQCIFGREKEARQRCTYQLMSSSWNHDPEMVEELLRYAQSRVDNDNGVVNTLAVLRRVEPEVLSAYEPELAGFLDGLKRLGPKTEKLRRGVLERVASVRSALEAYDPPSDGPDERPSRSAVPP